MAIKGEAYVPITLNDGRAKVLVGVKDNEFSGRTQQGQRRLHS
jgi:hypothetical protein